MEELWYKLNRRINRMLMLASKTTAATPQLDLGRLSPKEIHDLSREALVYIGNPQASPNTNQFRICYCSNTKLLYKNQWSKT